MHKIIDALRLTMNMEVETTLPTLVIEKDNTTIITGTGILPNSLLTISKLLLNTTLSTHFLDMKRWIIPIDTQRQVAKVVALMICKRH